MKNLKISSRLLISIFFFIVPLSMLLYFYTGELTKQIDFSVQEKRGTAYLRPLVNMLDDINEHQVAVYKGRAGEGSAKQHAAELYKKLESDIADIEAIQAQHGEALQFTPEGLKARKREALTIPNLKAKLGAIRSVAQSGAPISDLGPLYQSLADDLRGMITHAGDVSNLTLDPDLDSYYLMDIVVFAMPQAIGRYGILTGTVAPWLESHLSYDAEHVGQLASFVTMVSEADVARIRGDLDTAYNEDDKFYHDSTTLEPNTQGRMESYGQSAANLTGILGGLVKNSESAGLTAFLSAAEKANNDAAELWNASTGELDVMLDERIRTYDTYRDLTLAVSLGTIAVAFAFFFYVLGGIKKPLSQLQNAMIKIADGQLDTPVPCLKLKDELGDMARTLEIFKETAIESRSMEKEKQAEVQRESERQKSIETLINAFREKVAGLLGEVARSADSMQQAGTSLVAAADQTSSRMGTTVGAAAEASSNVEAVAAASEELTAAINEISRQVIRSSDITREAVSKTNSADATVQQLAESARRIGEVIGLISTIAEQINLLALNATIESARAGEAGKGFAVVATEVKTLATQTSKATEAITAQINEVQVVTGDVVKSLAQIQSTIIEVNSIASTIAAAVEEQGAATREIAVNIQHTSDRMQQVSTNMQEVSSVAATTNSNAHSVLQSVRDFSGQSNNLQQEVQSFLSNIAKA